MLVNRSLHWILIRQICCGNVSKRDLSSNCDCVCKRCLTTRSASGIPVNVPMTVAISGHRMMPILTPVLTTGGGKLNSRFRVCLIEWWFTAICANFQFHVAVQTDLRWQKCRVEQPVTQSQTIYLRNLTSNDHLQFIVIVENYRQGCVGECTWMSFILCNSTYFIFIHLYHFVKMCCLCKID